MIISLIEPRNLQSATPSKAWFKHPAIMKMQCMRSEDELLAADALKRYNTAKLEYDNLTGASQQQQQRQSGQLSAAQKSFLSRRQYGGDEITPERMQVYARGHERAIAAGLQPDTDAYFRSIEFFVDHQGDGRIPPLNEREAAKISGVSDEEYAAGAAKSAALKRGGFYQD
jgi:hypothetical protein